MAGKVIPLTPARNLRDGHIILPVRYESPGLPDNEQELKGPYAQPGRSGAQQVALGPLFLPGVDEGCPRPDGTWFAKAVSIATATLSVSASNKIPRAFIVTMMGFFVDLAGVGSSISLWYSDDNDTTSTATPTGTPIGDPLMRSDQFNGIGVQGLVFPNFRVERANQFLKAVFNNQSGATRIMQVVASLNYL